MKPYGLDAKRKRVVPNTLIQHVVDPEITTYFVLGRHNSTKVHPTNYCRSLPLILQIIIFKLIYYKVDTYEGEVP